VTTLPLVAPPLAAPSVDTPSVDVPSATVAAASPSTPDALLGTYKRAAPLFVRGDGVRLFDEQGTAYLDFVAGIAVTSLGHGDPGVARVIEAALATGLLHTSNLYRTAPGERLAAWLVARSFASKVFFCNSGAEANEAAFKFARRWARAQGHEEKVGIVALRGAFHGRLPGTLAATDRPGYRLPFRPLMPGVQIVERDLDELRAVLDPETVCAVIVEPIQGEGGVRVLDPAFLRALRALTRERDVLLILDEIQCGLGRTGHFFAHEGLDLVPDLLTIAKPLANGLPIGAVLLNEPVAGAVQPGDHGTTFGGGPLVAAVAEHVVQRLADPALLAHVRETGCWLQGELTALMQRTGKIRAIRGLGFMWGLDTHEPAAPIIGRAFANGLLLVSAGEHTLRLVPPLIMTREELRDGLAILEAALRDA
jgi:acetylornithine/N-succinyldiaminopimelate aminotransferase